ncbi:MAG: hypothetical protein WC209_16765 [Ignavibacteriaceae bacterium]
MENENKTKISWQKNNNLIEDTIQSFNLSAAKPPTSASGGLISE